MNREKNKIAPAGYVPLKEAAEICGLSVGALTQRCRREAVPCRKMKKGGKTIVLVRPCDVHPGKTPKRSAEVKAVAVLTPDENERVQISDGENARQSNAAEHGSERKEPVKRRPIDYVKNSMRKFTVSELLKVSNWINGRLGQKLQVEPTVG